MKITILLLAASLNGASLLAIQAEELRPVPPRAAQTNAPATPKFDAFVHRLQDCTGLLATANQWFKVMKPGLEDLGYTKEEIKAIKQRLSDHCATLDDAYLFSQRWAHKHGEPLNPHAIFACLPHDKTPAPQIAAR
jgi:hypothetical protein